MYSYYRYMPVLEYMVRLPGIKMRREECLGVSARIHRQIAEKRRRRKKQVRPHQALLDLVANVNDAIYRS